MRNKKKEPPPLQELEQVKQRLILDHNIFTQLNLDKAVCLQLFVNCVLDDTGLIRRHHRASLNDQYHLKGTRESIAQLFG